MRRAIILLIGLVLLIPVLSVPSASARPIVNRTDYPHRGEVIGYGETSPWVGRSNRRPRSMAIGDSILRGSLPALRATGFKGEVSAVPGRDVGNLPYYVRDRYDSRVERRRADNLIIALGSNASQGWTYNSLRDTVLLVPRKVKITFVTTWRDPVKFPETMPYRVRSSVQADYTRWMVLIAGWRPNTAIADWRGLVQRNPGAAPDGVHPHGWGATAWSQRVMHAVRWGR